MRILIGKIHHRHHLVHGKKHHGKNSNLEHLKEMLKDMNVTSHTASGLRKPKHKKITL